MADIVQIPAGFPSGSVGFNGTPIQNTIIVGNGGNNLENNDGPIDIIGGDIQMNTGDLLTVGTINGKGANDLVVGPATGTDNALPRFNGADGEVLQDSGVIVDDSDNISGIGNLSLTGTADGRDLAVDGTKLDAIRSYSSWMPPIGLSPDPANVNAEQTDAHAYFLYLGTILEAITTADFVARVKVAGTGIVWAEFAVFTGVFVPFGNASLTRRGFTDVSGVVNTTGTKVVTIALSGLAVGDGLWLAYGADRGAIGTDARLTGCGPDLIQSGVFQTVTGRPSLLASPVAVTLESATAIPGFAGLSV